MMPLPEHLVQALLELIRAVIADELFGLVRKLADRVWPENRISSARILNRPHPDSVAILPNRGYYEPNRGPCELLQVRVCSSRRLDPFGTNVAGSRHTPSRCN